MMHILADYICRASLFCLLLLLSGYRYSMSLYFELKHSNSQQTRPLHSLKAI
jgi:hypothetical protein